MAIIAGVNRRWQRKGAAVAYLGERAISAEETLRRVEPYLSRFGITRLGRLTGLDRVGIPVWNAVSPNSRSIVINQGKGVTDIDAKVSAAMEALERAIAYDPPIARRTATVRQLSTGQQPCQSLPALVAAGQPDLGDDTAIEWVSGTDLMTGQQTWVPFEAVSLDRTVAERRYWQSSDGLASGNTMLEATMHALLERIERDAYVLWSVSSRALRNGTCVDPRAFGDPTIDALTAKMTDAGLDLRLFDITSDIGIPSFSAFLAATDVATKRQPFFHDVTVGHGTYPAACRAVIRALTEVAQSRLTYISGARDDVFPHSFSQPLPPDTLALLAARPHKVASPDCGPFADAQAILAFLIERLRLRGIGSVIHVGLDGGDLPFFVAKVLVPGLENPEGQRKRRFGHRALSRSLEMA